MSISVVVPNYNHAHYLRIALASILAQEARADQIIVVDDKSTDDSIAVVEEFARRHPEIELVRHEQNRGPPAALNTGLRRARGEFVAFIGADDLMLPAMLARTIEALKRHPQAAFACGEVALLGPDEGILGFRPFALPSWRNRYLSSEAVTRLIEHSDNWIVGTATVIRREVLERLGGFDETLGSFCDGMVGRQLAFTHGFCFVPEVLGVWRRGPRTYSASTALSPEENLRVLNGTLDRFASTIGQKLAARYREPFGRRWRFGAAQSILLWELALPEVDRLVVAMGGDDLDRRVLDGIRRVAGQGGLCRKLSLAWITHRTRPMRKSTLLTSALRSFVLSPIRRNRVYRQLGAIAPDRAHVLASEITHAG